MRPAGAPPTVMSKKTLSVTFPESPGAARAANERRAVAGEDDRRSAVILRGAAMEEEVEVEVGVEVGRRSAAWTATDDEDLIEATAERAPRAVAIVDACFVCVCVDDFVSIRYQSEKKEERGKEESERARGRGGMKMFVKLGVCMRIHVDG